MIKWNIWVLRKDHGPAKVYGHFPSEEAASAHRIKLAAQIASNNDSVYMSKPMFILTEGRNV